MNEINKQTVAWYVMRVTYQREIAASKLLDEMNVNNFVPTCRVKIRNDEGLAIGWKTDPLVHNYIFIHDTFNNILLIKQGKLDYLRFVMAKDSETGESVPQYVPDKQMSDFMKVVRTMGSKPLDPNIDLHKGDRVRVLTGPFEGVEGVYIKMPNRHEKRVVVKIEGIAAVATVALNASDVEKLDPAPAKPQKRKVYNF